MTSLVSERRDLQRNSATNVWVNRIGFEKITGVALATFATFAYDWGFSYSKAGATAFAFASVTLLSEKMMRNNSITISRDNYEKKSWFASFHIKPFEFIQSKTFLATFIYSCFMYIQYNLPENPRTVQYLVQRSIKRIAFDFFIMTPMRAVFNHAFIRERVEDIVNLIDRKIIFIKNKPMIEIISHNIIVSALRMKPAYGFHVNMYLFCSSTIPSLLVNMERNFKKSNNSTIIPLIEMNWISNAIYIISLLIIGRLKGNF